MSSARILRYFKTSPKIIRLAVMMYVRYPLSLRNVEDLLHQRGIDIDQETLRFRRMRSLRKFAAVHGSIHDRLASRPFGSTRNGTSQPDKNSGKDEPPL